MKIYQPLIDFNWNLLFSLLTFLALFIFLYVFFFKRIHNFMEQRKANIEEQVENAKLANQEADARLEKYQNVINDAETERRKIINDAREMADKEGEQIIKTAKSDAVNIIAKAEVEAQEERVKATRQMKEDIAEIAVMAASRIVQKELDKGTHEEIIDKVIKEAGAGKWQS